MNEFYDYTESYQGLSTQNADENLKLYGYNLDSKTEDVQKMFRLSSVFLSLRFVLMLASSVVYFMGGEIVFGSVCLFLVIIYCITEIIKGRKCDEAISKLNRSTNIRFRVIRDGEITLLPMERIVPDDIIVLQAGENVPADAHILSESGITCDERLFTGDKEPATKIVGADSKNEIKQSCVYKGTRILSGHLAARVIATGMDTKKFKCFGEVQPIDTYTTAFENTINKIIPVLSIIGFVLFIGVALILFLRGDTDDALQLVVDTLIPAIAFSLCFIPAETASMVRLFYTLTALKLAKTGSIAKGLSAIEKLGSITSVIVEKTGIITKDNIEVAEEFTKNPEMLTNISILSCDKNEPSVFDQAIIINAAFKHINVKELQQNELIKSFPFSEEFNLGGNLWRINGSRLLCIKGAPENIFTVCNILPDQLYSLQKKQHQYAKEGYQVMALAYVRLAEDQLIPEVIHDLKFNFAGLLAFTNQTRDSIPDAVRGCYRSGVKMIMTTGDSPDTAKAIGEKIGLKSIKIMTGDELKEITQSGQTPDITSINVFAKTSPEQRLDIIKLLKENGEIVATTGDGPSDVDMLLEADIGITRSLSTTGAAQEACDLIMSDENFNAVVEAIKESRQTHRNIKAAVSLSISSTIVFVLFSALNLILGEAPVLNIVLLSLLSIVIIPAIMLIYASNSSDMKLSFRASGFIGRGDIDNKFFLSAILKGLALFVATLFLYFLLPEADNATKSACLVSTVTAGLITMAWVNLSVHVPAYKSIFLKNSNSGVISGLILLFLMLIIYVPFVNSLFGLSGINLLIFLLSVVLGILSQIGFDFAKKNNK